MGYVAELRAIIGHRPLILVAVGALILDDQERLLLQHRFVFAVHSARAPTPRPLGRCNTELTGA